MENGARNGNTCPPSPSRSPLFLAPIVHQISGIPKYEPTPIPRGYQLLIPIFLSRGKERSEKNGENAMKAEAKSTLLPSLIGTKHISEIQKLFPESKTLPLIQNIPEFKNTSQTPKHVPERFWEVFWILGCDFGFWNAFWILGSVFGFLEMFLNSGMCFGFWELFCPYEPPYTTFVITWHTYLGSSTADHINLSFGIKWPPGRNKRGEVSGTKKTVVPPSSFMALRDRFRSFLGLDVGIFIIYTDCAANLFRNSVERKAYSIDKCKLIFA